MSTRKQKVIFFDLMGTCCDWLSSMLPTLLACPSHVSLKPAKKELRELAIAWREGFFDEIHTRFNNGEPAENIDVTHRRVLDRLLAERGIGLDTWDHNIRERLVHQWHEQLPWTDVLPALNRLRSDGKWFLIVLANGTARLQLDIVQSAGLPFHSLLSSEILGLTKPDPAIYKKAMELVQLPPEDCIMLASHLYDLKAAKRAGMQTIYVHRTTEDVGTVTVDPHGEHDYVDLYFDGRDELHGGHVYGFIDVARYLIDMEH